MVLNFATKLGFGALTLGTVVTTSYLGTACLSNNEKEIQKPKVKK